MRHALVILGLAALLLGAQPVQAQSQSIPFSYLSATGTNSRLIKVGRSKLKWILPVNTTSAIYYLKLYDKATAPTCGTDVPKLRIPVPHASGAGNGVVADLQNVPFTRGIGMCLVSGIADNDTGNAAAGVALNFGIE